MLTMLEKTSAFLRRKKTLRLLYCITLALYVALFVISYNLAGEALDYVAEGISILSFLISFLLSFFKKPPEVNQLRTLCYVIVSSIGFFLILLSETSTKAAISATFGGFILILLDVIFD